MQNAPKKKRSAIKTAALILFALGGWGAAVITGMGLGAERNKAAQAAKAAGAAEPGTAEAAQAAVLDYLGRFYTVVDAPPAIQGDTATMKARFVGHQCAFVLTRHPSANPSGWTIQRHECDQGAPQH